MADDMHEDDRLSAHELGRMTEQMRNLVTCVGKLESTIQDQAKHFASQRDLDRVEKTANEARDEALATKAKLSSMSFWERIAAIVIAGLIMLGLAAQKFPK